eukprot:TRINITY_DN7349_c0_g1_i1.p1 TRINITY_DN7349_c0_g1~~TRINITY_DN7349_c0_g1_i1.p1  ORF type:complete len:445 (-),score=56.93 TRINITY_DN7349_c0_g1_i1:259-1398(-)
MVDGMIVTCLTKACFEEIQKSVPENVVGESVQVLDQEQLVKEYQPGRVFNFEVEMDLQPSIRWLGDYKDIKVQVKDIQSMVNYENVGRETLRRLLKPKGKLVEVKDRGVKKDDVVKMSYEGVRVDTGEMVPGMKRDNFEHDLEVTLIPGFEDNLVGLFKGEQTGFQIVFPQEWEPKFMGGVQLRFKVTIHEILEYDLPEMTDELATELSSGLCKEKDKIQEYFQEQIQNRVEQDQMNLVFEELSKEFNDLVELKVPEYVVMDQARLEYSQRILEAVEKGQISQSVVQQMTTPEMIKDYANKHRSSIEKQIKTRYAIDDIIEKENIQIAEEEVIEQLKEAKLMQFEESVTDEEIREQVIEYLNTIKLLALFQKWNSISFI